MVELFGWFDFETKANHESVVTTLIKKHLIWMLFVFGPVKGFGGGFGCGGNIRLLFFGARILREK